MFKHTLRVCRYRPETWLSIIRRRYSLGYLTLKSFGSDEGPSQERDPVCPPEPGLHTRFHFIQIHGEGANTFKWLPVDD